MDESEFGIVVAVGPDGLGDGTLDYAASEAARLDTGVELIHVVHSMAVAVPTSTEQAPLDRALTRVGREVLTETAERLRQRLGGRAPVNTEIVFGPVARTIADRGSRARQIVLERRDIGTVERFVTMSISSSVAAHAAVPVVVVPPTWSADRGDLPITVGVDRSPDATSEVPSAIDLARATGRSLVVLHATWVAEPYQNVLFTEYPRDRWVTDAARELDSAVSGLDGADADLTCDVRWGRPVDALVDATERSSLLVLSRRAASFPHLAHLGATTRAVLHHAACPVMVVDRAGARATGGDDVVSRVPS